MICASSERRADEEGAPAAPTSRVERILCFAQSANAVGDGAFYVTSAMAFSRLLGMSVLQIGVALTVAWGVAFALTVPIGSLADRIGLRGSAVALSIATASAILLLLVARTNWAFTLAVTAYAIAQSGSQSVRQALFGTLVPPTRRVVARARMQAIANAGVGVGAACGGLAVYLYPQSAFVAVFVLDAIGFLLSAAILSRLPRPPVHRRDTRGSSWAVLRDRPYVAAAALNAVLYLYMPMLSVTLPLYIIQRTHAFDWSIAVLFVLNTVGVVALQIRAAKRVTGLVSGARSFRLAGWAMLAACGVFALAALPTSPYVALGVLGIGIGLQVVGEVLLASGSWEIGFTLAHPRLPGQWQGLYNSGIAVARSVGPIALAYLVLTWSGPGWLVLGAGFLLAASAMPFAVARGLKNRPAATGVDA